MINGIALLLSTDFLSGNRSGRLFIIVANKLFKKGMLDTRKGEKGRGGREEKGENMCLSSVPSHQ